MGKPTTRHGSRNTTIGDGHEEALPIPMPIAVHPVSKNSSSATSSSLPARSKKKKNSIDGGPHIPATSEARQDKKEFDFERFKTLFNCGICSGPFNNPVQLPCSHVFCNDCLKYNHASTSSTATKQQSAQPIPKLQTSCQVCHTKLTRRSVLVPRVDLQELHQRYQLALKVYEEELVKFDDKAPGHQEAHAHSISHSDGYDLGDNRQDDVNEVRVGESTREGEVAIQKMNTSTRSRRSSKNIKARGNLPKEKHIGLSESQKELLLTNNEEKENINLTRTTKDGVLALSIDELAVMHLINQDERPQDEADLADCAMDTHENEEQEEVIVPRDSPKPYPNLSSNMSSEEGLNLFHSEKDAELLQPFPVSQNVQKQQEVITDIGISEGHKTNETEYNKHEHDSIQIVRNENEILIDHHEDKNNFKNSGIAGGINLNSVEVGTNYENYGPIDLTVSHSHKNESTKKLKKCALTFVKPLDLTMKYSSKPKVAAFAGASEIVWKTPVQFSKAPRILEAPILSNNLKSSRSNNYQPSKPSPTSTLQLQSKKLRDGACEPKIHVRLPYQSSINNEGKEKRVFDTQTCSDAFLGQLHFDDEDEGIDNGQIQNYDYESSVADNSVQFLRHLDEGNDHLATANFDDPCNASVHHEKTRTNNPEEDEDEAFSSGSTCIDLGKIAKSMVENAEYEMDLNSVSQKNKTSTQPQSLQVDRVEMMETNSLDSFDRDMMKCNLEFIENNHEKDEEKKEEEQHEPENNNVLDNPENSMWPNNSDDGNDSDFLVATPGTPQRNKCNNPNSLAYESANESPSHIIKLMNEDYERERSKPQVLMNRLEELGNDDVGNSSLTPLLSNGRQAGVLDKGLILTNPSLPSSSPSISTPKSVCFNKNVAIASTKAMDPMVRTTDKPALAVGRVPQSQTKSSYIFCPTRLSRLQLQKLQLLCKILPGAISKDYTDEVTHLILNLENERVPQTMKYLLAIAGKKWVITFEWVEECLKQNGLVYEEPYETSNFRYCDPGVKKSRLSPSGLFTDISFYIGGHMLSSGASVPDCKALLMKLGGNIIGNPSEANENILIIGDKLDSDVNYGKWFKEKGWLTVNWEWILDCILSFSIVPFLPSHLITQITGRNFSGINLPKGIQEAVNSN